MMASTFLDRYSPEGDPQAQIGVMGVAADIRGDPLLSLQLCVGGPFA
jgi:hypothetical protein